MATTIKQQLIDAIVATGGTLIESRSSKYVTLKRPNGSFYFVGKAGALRYGKSVSDSYSASDELKALIIRAGAKAKAENKIVS